MRNRTVTTHEPQGQALLRGLGFLDSEDDLDRSNHEGICEFPFSPPAEYPKFTVEDSLVPVKVTKKGSNHNGNQNVTWQPHHPPHSNRNHSGGGNQTDSEGHPRGMYVLAHKKLHLPHPRDDIGQLDSLDNEWDDADNYDYMNGNPEARRKLRSVEHQFSGGDYDDDESDQALLDEMLEPYEEEKEEIPMYLRVPEQNIDAYVEKTKITDDLTEIEEKMHELTWYSFRDTTHTVPNPKAVYFGQGRRSNNKRRNDVNKELKKLLQVGEYSHSNPIVSRVGLYLNPLIGACQSMLCLVRALFNAFTFQDPFLSFWIFIFGWMVTFVLFFFPWRLFMFAAGIIIVGPQNWLFRKINERRKKRPKKKKKKKNDTKKEVPEEKKYRIPRDQPLFKAHPPANSRFREIDPATLNPKAIHHAVVPYSPLMYQRFYDWPPEPEYSHVRLPPITKRRSSLAQLRLAADVVMAGHGFTHNISHNPHKMLMRDIPESRDL